MLLRLKQFVTNLTLSIPVMMVLGFLYGSTGPVAWLHYMIVPFTFLMVYPMMVTLKVRSVFSGGDLKPLVLTHLLNFGVIPFLAYGVGQMFFPDRPYLALGLLLAGLVPTSGMTISWTGFARGNVAAAVKITLLGLVVGSLATPLYAKALLGASIDVGMNAVFRQIVLIVFLPMLLGYATQRILVSRYGQQAFTKTLAPKFPALSMVGVLGIVFVALALKARTIVSSPELLLYLFMPLVMLYALNFLLSTVVGRAMLPRGDAIAMVYGSAMRNLSIALAISMNAFGSQGADAALVVAVAYVIQVQSAAWYVKFTDVVFGTVQEAEAVAD